MRGEINQPKGKCHRPIIEEPDQINITIGWESIRNDGLSKENMVYGKLDGIVEDMLTTILLRR